jgi:hypothetical protein
MFFEKLSPSSENLSGFGVDKSKSLADINIEKLELLETVDGEKMFFEILCKKIHSGVILCEKSIARTHLFRKK